MTMPPPQLHSGLPKLTVLKGATPFSFILRESIARTQKRVVGAVMKATGEQKEEDIIGAPWHIKGIHGIGCNKWDEFIFNEPDGACVWEMANIDAWPGVWGKGPLKQVPTGSTLPTVAVKAFAQAGGIAWAFQQATGAAVENLFYFAGLTTTWANATATADWEGVAGNPTGFPVGAIVDGLDGRVYVIRQTGTLNVNYYQMGSATYAAPTVWNFPGVAAFGDQPSGDTASTCYGAVVIDATMYALIWNGTSKISLRTSTNTPFQVWSILGTINSPKAPTSIFAWVDSKGNRRCYFATPLGIWRYNISTDTPASTIVQIVDFSQYQDTNNGLSPVVWNVEGLPGGFLVVPQGRNIFMLSWEGQSGNLRVQNIAPTYKTQGLPTARQGRVLALAATSQFLYVSIGGEDASHVGGLYRILPPKPNAPHIACIGPIYDRVTANRQIQALMFSTSDDNTERLHQADEVTAGGASALFYFLNTEQDPRTVSGYKHTAAIGSLILARNDRGLPELAGIWRKIEFWGELTANNQVKNIYVSADVAAQDLTNGTWGASIGGATATGGSANFVATPAGTGQNANLMQIRIDIDGTSNNSPYINVINVYVKKYVPLKRHFDFIIDLKESAGLGGTTRPIDSVLADIDAISVPGQDLVVTCGSELVAVTMEPFLYSGFGFLPTAEGNVGVDELGTSGGQTTGETYTLRLAEV